MIEPETIDELKEYLEKENHCFLLYFTATWCGPCRLEIPELMELQSHYSNLPVKIIGISVDRNIASVERYLKEYAITYPIVMYTAEHTSYFGQVSAIPTTFILDKQGRIAHVLKGYRNQYELHTLIDPLL